MIRMYFPGMPFIYFVGPQRVFLPGVLKAFLKVDEIDLGKYYIQGRTAR